MSNSYPSGSVGISFQSLSVGDQASSSGGASLSLDDAKNLLVYREDKNSFLVGETAYLKLHCPEPGYGLDCSAGNVSRDVSSVAYPYEEDIVFSLSRTEELQQIPYGAIKHEWIGKNGGTPLFSVKVVTIPVPRTAILRCEYKSLGDRLKLLVTSADTGAHASMDVLVVVHKDGNVLASMTVTYENKGVAVPVPVELSVADFCSDMQVAGVDVFLDGSFVGTTDANGKFFLGELMQGSQYQLKMIRNGYVDSDLDILLNDTFTVPVE